MRCRVRPIPVTAGAPTAEVLYYGDARVEEADVANNVIRRYVHATNANPDDPTAWYESATMDGMTERVLRTNWQGSVTLMTWT